MPDLQPSQFAEFTFDPGTRQLRRGGQEIHLSPEAFELLRILIAARPRALSKQELQAALWPDAFVTEANLPTLAKEIRAALEDDPRRPRFIRTLHGFGYAFATAAPEPGASRHPRHLHLLDRRRQPRAPQRGYEHSRPRS